MHTKISPVALAWFAFSVLAVRADTAVKCNYKSLAACPKIGCSKPGSPLAATNSQKRTTAINGNPTEITFHDLKMLQDDVDSKFHNTPVVFKGEKVSSPRNMKGAARKFLLSGLKTGSGPFSEGDYVELSGFIASKKLPPHPNTGESVNCKLKDEPSNDYHINITGEKNQEETDGVVVEMIPQDPNRKDKDWSLEKLKVIQAKQLLVKIDGRLFFDSEHRPNTGGKAGGNPRRFSVWEIHPAVKFFVCESGSCAKSTAWKPLEHWTPSP